MMQRELKQVSLTRRLGKRSLDSAIHDLSPAKRTKSDDFLRVEDVYSSSEEEVTDTENFTCPHCDKAIEAPNATIKSLHIAVCRAVVEEERSQGPEEDSSPDTDLASRDEGEEADDDFPPDSIFHDGLGAQDQDPDLSHLPETSGEEVYSPSSEEEMGGHAPRQKLLTQEERVVEGLLGKVERPKVEVVLTPETGRGVVAREKIQKGVYVCEYKTSAVYPAQDREQDELHSRNARGMFVMESAFKVTPGSGRLCFDATDRFHHPGRFINHVTRGANLKPMKPVYVREKWRVGFLSLREIEVGEELCFDYGLRTDEEWTRKGRLEDRRVTCGKGRVREGGERDADVDGQLEGRCAEVKAEAKLESAEVREAKKPEIEKKEGGKKEPIRKSWWCPIVGCPSGPVQKVEQHFQTCHHLPIKSRANYRLRKYKLAPSREAIQLKLPNPYARHTLGSSRTLDQFATPGPSRELQRHVRLDTLVRVEAKGGSKGKKGSGGFKSGERTGKGRAGSAESGGRKGKGRAGSAECGGRKGKGRAGSAESGGRKGKGRAGSAKQRGRVASPFTRAEPEPNEPLESEEDMGEGGVGLESADQCDGETFLQKFKLFLLSPLGGSRNEKTASQIETNVRKYLRELDMNPRRLVDLKPVQPFITQVQEEGIGCSGILQRLDAHSLALKFLNFTEEEEGLSGMVQRAHEFLKSFRRCFKAQKVSEERKSIEAKAYNPPDLSGVDQFLTDVSIRDEFLTTAEDILMSPEPSKRQYNTCLAIIAGRVLYSNAQRPGAVTGALLSEYEEGFKGKKKGESYLTIRVQAHKTGSSESAKLVISRETLKLLAVWEDVRDKVAEESPYLFPDFKGGQVSHLTRVVIRYAEEKNITLPNAQSVRTTVELKTKHMAAPVQEAVARSLSHSQATVHKHYRANDKQSGHLAFETIQSIVSGDKESDKKTEEPRESGLGRGPPKKPKRKPFSEEENQIVKEYFSSNIANKEPPLKADSQKFLDSQPDNLFQGRTPHDIYDKVRNLIGRK